MALLDALKPFANCWPVPRLRAVYYKSKHVGKGSFVAASAQVIGWRETRIGKYTCIGDDTFININHRGPGKIGLIIGDNCFIGKRNFFTTGKQIRIGDYCITAPGCQFLGAYHQYDNPFTSYAMSPCAEEHTIDIGTNCFIGARATIMHHVKVGFGSVIGAGAVVSRDVPPLSLVTGIQGEIKKRFSLRSNAWVKVDEYSKDDDALLPSEEEYLEALRKKLNVSPD